MTDVLERPAQQVEQRDRTDGADHTSPTGYMIPLVGAIILTLLWGGYTIIEAMGILSGRPI